MSRSPLEAARFPLSGHLGLIYADTALFVVGALLALASLFDRRAA